MSIAAITAPTAQESPLGPAAAAQRIEHLQDLIAKVQAGPASFAAALQAAQTSTEQTGSTQLTAAQTAAPQTSMAQTAATQALPTDTYPASTDVSALPITGPAAATTAYSPASDTIPASSGNEAGSEYDSLIEQAAARNGIDPAVLHGLIQQESGFDPNSTSGAGALGLTQLMPGTAASLGITDPLDPAQSIEGGARYLGEMLRQFGGNTQDALAAYNAGPGAVQRYGGVPPYAETQQYVTKVLDYAAQYSSSHPSSTVSPQAAIV